MSGTDIDHVKNAPLRLPVDRSRFVAWANSIPDGNVSAGWQSNDPRPAADPSTRLLRRSASKLVSLARRESSQSPQQIAERAGVCLTDIVAMELGDEIRNEAVVRRVADALHLNASILLQMYGLARLSDARLLQAATDFVVRIESVQPLEPQESEALQRFRDVVKADDSLKVG